MTETKIFVGLNDSETGEQKLETEKYIQILKTVCCSYGVAFSFSVVQGGYLHEDGRYTQENTLAITLIDTEKKKIDNIAKDLCVFFHQESVMITQNLVRSYFIKESLEK